jgi:hypothetical protein
MVTDCNGQKFDEELLGLSERCVLGNISSFGKNDLLHFV